VEAEVIRQILFRSGETRELFLEQLFSDRKMDVVLKQVFGDGFGVLTSAIVFTLPYIAMFTTDSFSPLSCLVD
jgi:hypothetical protein